MKNKDFNFSYSITTTRYDRNNDKANTLQWWKTNTNVTEFIHNVKNGYAFSNVFQTNDFIFDNSSKTDNNIKSCNLITFDFDAVKYSYNEFFELMQQTEIPPTLIYTTQNDGKYKDGKKETYCNRYRVIYIIDKPIYNNTLYKSLHQAIKKEIELITNDSNVWNDNTDCSISHFFGGNLYAKIINTNEIYSLDWLIERYNINESNCKVEELKKEYTNVLLTKNECLSKVANQSNNTSFSSSTNIITLCGKFYMKDFYDMPIIEFLNKYKSMYDITDATPLSDNGKLIVDVPSDYTEIRRKFKIEKIQARNGKLYNIPITQKLQDGERRRKKLYLNLLLHKRIKPNISLEHLMYIAMYELYFYIDNTKDVISKKEIANIAINAYKSDVTIEDKKRPKYKINKEYCKRNNIKPKTANIIYVNEQRKEKKQERNERIKSIFNPTLTDTKNLEVLKENGINISLRTLIRWKKENGLQGRNTTKNKKQYHPKIAHIAKQSDISAVPTNHKESSIKEDTTLQSETENNENKNNTNEMAKKVIISETRNNDYIMLKLLSFDSYLNEYYVKAIKDDLSAYNETNI